MSKKKFVQTEKQRRYQEEAARKRQEKARFQIGEQRKSAIVLLSIALAMLLAAIGFFIWHTVRMRDFELNYVRTEGRVSDVSVHHSSTSGHGSRTYYTLVVTYTYEGEEHTFQDSVGYSAPMYDKIGAKTAIYVNPQNPARAVKVTSADDVSIVFTLFFAFFCTTYSVGMNVFLSTRGSTLLKRFLFVWGAELLFAAAWLLLLWLGLPNDGFGAVFTRIEGAIGVAVVAGLLLAVFLTDVLITYKLRPKKIDSRAEAIDRVIRK